MKKAFFIFILSICCFALFGQQDSTLQKLNSFVKNIGTFNHLYPQEKVFLHFDNAAYFLGETMWFKSYVVKAEDNQLSPLSKILYVELLNPEGNIIETKKMKLENGQAHGEFLLKDSLFAGYYEVRAYTKSMLNFGEEVIFSRVFPVFDKPKEDRPLLEKTMKPRPWSREIRNRREQKTSKLKNINIEFYPEGGNLVKGLNNRIAFKATGKQGESVSVSGAICNAQGLEITTFESVYNGTGIINLTPNEARYTAKVIFEGEQTKFNLPLSIAHGYTLQVNNLNNSNLYLQVDKSESVKDEIIGLTLSCRGKVCLFDTLQVKSGASSVLKIPKESLPPGVIQITIFTTEGQILAERLIFNKRNEIGSINVNSIKTTYAPHSPVKIDFEVKGKDNNPVETTFSLSVKDAATTIETSYTDNMMTNLLLSSELKGYVENSAYYFEANDNQHNIALDLLMMTQGWRRYSWQQMAGVIPFEVKYHIEKGLQMEGQVIALTNKKGKQDIDVTMWMLTPYQKAVCKTDSVGRFNFMLDDFYGKQDLTLETRHKGKMIFSRVILDRLFSPEVKPYEYAQLIIKEDIKTKNSLLDHAATEDSIYEGELLIADSIKFHKLKEVTVTKKRKKTIKESILSNAALALDFDDRLDDVRDAAGYETDSLDDFLIRNYPEYFDFILDENGNQFLKYRHKGRLLSVTLRSQGFEDLGLLDINDIKTIVISPLSLMIKSQEDFVYVDIFTYENRIRRKERKGERRTHFLGYANVSEFKIPDYSKVVLPDEKDYRRTLYWNPNVKTDSVGKVSVDFYNSSTSKGFDVSSESLLIVNGK